MSTLQIRIPHGKYVHYAIASQVLAAPLSIGLGFLVHWSVGAGYEVAWLFVLFDEYYRRNVRLI